MQRRQFVSLAVVALGGCVSASGGTGPRNPPTTPADGGPVVDDEGLRIVDAVPREGAEGRLVLAVSVENTAGSRRSDTLVGRATVTTDSGEVEYEASREVSLGADAAAEVELAFDVGYEAWAGNGGLAYGWVGEL